MTTKEQTKKSNKVTIWISDTQHGLIEELKVLTGEHSVSFIIRQAIDDLYAKLASK